MNQLLLFLKPRTALAEHPEIMVRELQIIFGIDPIALHLRVTRQRLVFLEELGGIAARATSGNGVSRRLHGRRGPSPPRASRFIALSHVNQGFV